MARTGSWLSGGLQAMRSVTCFLALLVLVAAGASARAQDAGRADPQIIGYVKTVNGEAHVQRGAERIPAEPGTAVYRDDTLYTGEPGALGVTLKDSTRLSLGPRSELTLRRFDFDPAEERLGFVARLTRGTLLYISGVIARLSADSVSIETPVATVAVRGTRFLARVEEQVP